MPLVRVVIAGWRRHRFLIRGPSIYGAARDRIRQIPPLRYLRLFPLLRIRIGNLSATLRPEIEANGYEDKLTSRSRLTYDDEDDGDERGKRIGYLSAAVGASVRLFSIRATHRDRVTFYCYLLRTRVGFFLGNCGRGRDLVAVEKHWRGRGEEKSGGFKV